MSAKEFKELFGRRPGWGDVIRAEHRGITTGNPNRVVWSCQAKPRCESDDCTNFALVEMECTRDVQEWIYLECDTCLSLLCETHGDVDDEGTVTCDDCLQTAAIRAQQA